MGTVDYDVGPFTGTANQLTVPSGWGGKYLVSAQWRIDIGGASAGHYCVVAVYLNASTPIASELVHATGAGAVFTCTMSTSTIHALVATDHLRLYVNPDANCSSVNSQPANVYPSLQVMWLAP
jgi:hypothetical protein